MWRKGQAQERHNGGGTADADGGVEFVVPGFHNGVPAGVQQCGEQQNAENGKGHSADVIRECHKNVTYHHRISICDVKGERLPAPL